MPLHKALSAVARGVPSSVSYTPDSYRWDGEGRPKAWWREVPDAAHVEEEWWLAGHVYSGDALPRALGPEIRRITWRERYRPHAPSSDWDDNRHPKCR